MTGELPGGGKPWFERRKKVRPFGTTRWQLVPVSKEGWMVIAAYVAVLALDTFVLLLPEPGALRLTLYLTILTVATVLLIVVAFRMSAPGWRDK